MTLNSQDKENIKKFLDCKMADFLKPLDPDGIVARLCERLQIKLHLVIDNADNKNNLYNFIRSELKKILVDAAREIKDLTQDGVTDFEQTLRRDIHFPLTHFIQDLKKDKGEKFGPPREGNGKKI